MELFDTMRDRVGGGTVKDLVGEDTVQWAVDQPEAPESGAGDPLLVLSARIARLSSATCRKISTSSGSNCLPLLARSSSAAFSTVRARR